MLEIVDTICDALFFLDMLANFRTSYVSQKTGLEVTDTKMIACNYLSHRGTFWIDLVSTLPFDKIFEVSSTLDIESSSA